MPQEQSQKSDDPPIGQCAVCGERITRDDPGKLELSLATGTMTHVHDRCRGSARSPRPREQDPTS